MFNRWKDDVTGFVSTRWSYASVSNDSKDFQLNKIWRRCFASKTLWRLLIATTLLLATVAIVFSPPARDTISRHVWTKPSEDLHDVATDWSQYAYCQYVTNEAYLCNSMMIFESLTRLGARADRLMMYPEEWVVGDSGSVPGRLLAKARDEYGVKLVPITVQHFVGEPTWADSFTKLLAFNQTQYKRVLSLDSDATVLQAMDELFLLPPAPVAMPRAYWLDNHVLSSQLVVVEPSEFEFKRILTAFETRGTNDFDMEIVNNLYADNCFIIPHRRYDLLTGEFRAAEHHRYLGSKEEQWDPVKIFKEAKFLHFSDWPHPKPWIHAGAGSVAQHQPKCTVNSETGAEDCRDQEIWLGIYADFRERRKAVCNEHLEKRMLEHTDIAPPSRWEPVF